MTGRLYGVGLGPGDPELVTRKAWRLIQSASVVAYPAPLGGESFARSIAAEAIRDDAEEIAIEIPMRAERFPAQEVYDAAAQRVRERVEDGLDVVVLCEGDPFFYGSFMYLFERLAGRVPIEVVPGVTSLTACAASLGRPLVGRDDVLTVLPGTLPREDLKVRLRDAHAAAILKVGRRLVPLRELIGEMGLLDRAGYVERASLPNARVAPLAEAPDDAPYFSMILIYQGGEPWSMQPQ